MLEIALVKSSCYVCTTYHMHLPTLKVKKGRRATQDEPESPLVSNDPVEMSL